MKLLVFLSSFLNHSRHSHHRRLIWSGVWGPATSTLVSHRSQNLPYNDTSEG